MYAKLVSPGTRDFDPLWPRPNVCAIYGEIPLWVCEVGYSPL